MNEHVTFPAQPRIGPLIGARPHFLVGSPLGADRDRDLGTRCEGDAGQTNLAPIFHGRRCFVDFHGACAPFSCIVPAIRPSINLNRPTDGCGGRYAAPAGSGARASSAERSRSWTRILAVMSWWRSVLKSDLKRRSLR